MAEEIREVLNLLNEKLAGLFPYRLEMVTPGELKLLEKNARYMKAEQFQSLVENIKKDGNLSSLPLCYREKDGKLRRTARALPCTTGIGRRSTTSLSKAHRPRMARRG